MKVWFVDDDQEMIQAVTLMLGLLDYELRSFEDARSAAKALLDGELPDVLLLDVNMPEVSGVDLLEFIRGRPEWKQLPILMLSTEVTNEKVDRAFSLGADGFIIKPVTIDELETAIGKAIQKHSSVN
jgi:two-component system chemotaxis response regulator CheY